MGTFLLLKNFFCGSSNVSFCLTVPHLMCFWLLVGGFWSKNGSKTADRYKKVRQSEHYFSIVFIYCCLVVTLGISGEVCKA